MNNIRLLAHMNTIINTRETSVSRKTERKVQCGIRHRVVLNKDASESPSFSASLVLLWCSIALPFSG